MNFIRVILKIQREVFSEAPFKKKVGSLFGRCSDSSSFWPLSSVHFETFVYPQTIIASIFIYAKIDNPFFYKGASSILQHTPEKMYTRCSLFSKHTAPSLPPPSMCVCVPAGGCYSPLWPVVIRHFFPV